MKIEFIDTDLHEVDEVEVQAMVVSAFRDERPFYGMAGLVDWRMCAALSRMALDNFITSDLGEAVMVPSLRLNATAIILLGLGSSNQFGSVEIKALGTKISALIRGLHLSNLLIDLPGSPVSKMDAGKRMQFLMEAMKANGVLGAENTRLLIAEKAQFHGHLREIARRFGPGYKGGRYG